MNRRYSKNHPAVRYARRQRRAEQFLWAVLLACCLACVALVAMPVIAFAGFPVTGFLVFVPAGGIAWAVVALAELDRDGK